MAQRPPTRWRDPAACPREGCDTTRYTPLGMAFHLLDEHSVRLYPVVA